MDEAGSRVERWRRRCIEHPLLAGAAFWVLSGTAAALLIVGLGTHSRDLSSRLSDHGATTVATVTRTRPQDGNLVAYRYVVGGTTYRDTSFADGPDGKAEDLSIGDQIHIVYDTGDPSRTCYCEPSDRARDNSWRSSLLGGLWLAALWSVLLTVVLVRKRRRSPSE